MTRLGRQLRKLGVASGLLIAASTAPIQLSHHTVSPDTVAATHGPRNPIWDGVLKNAELR